MTYQEVTDYLFNKTANYEKQGTAGYKEGMENTEALDEHFGHPHEKFRCIHIAGTNGKGSVSHTVAAVLQACGYRVGLYTSPHLIDFRERIRVDGKPVSEEYVVSFVEQNKQLFDQMQPSFFEITTAMAFKYFSEADVDIAVVEVGLGGRLDCTNIISPILSVITNISLDHTQLLGSSIEQIAMEKGGIIKKGTPVVIGEATPETRTVFDVLANEAKAPIVYAEDHPYIAHSEMMKDGKMQYKTVGRTVFEGELSGSYQLKNTNTILHVIAQLAAQNYLDATATEPAALQEVQYAFKNVCRMTGLMGRWQELRQAPKVVCDTGHNVAGWEYLSRQLAAVACHHLHIVFGMVDDKDVYGVMALLPKNATYYYTKGSTKRAFPETSLKVFGSQFGLTGECYPTVAEAYKAALLAADSDDFIFVGGSTYVVADLLKMNV